MLYLPAQPPNPLLFLSSLSRKRLKLHSLTASISMCVMKRYGPQAENISTTQSQTTNSYKSSSPPAASGLIISLQLSLWIRQSFFLEIRWRICILSMYKKLIEYSVMALKIDIGLYWVPFLSQEWQLTARISTKTALIWIASFSSASFQKTSRVA